MFVYYYRIFDRYGVDVVNLAVCTDVLPAAHTAPYQRARWGCELTFRFPVVQIRHTGRDWARLEQDLKPFAVVVMAHLKAREVRDGAERKQWKLRILRGLYEHGYNRAEILTLFRFIDWLLVLPAALEQEFWHEFRQFEEEKHMPYVTSVERRGFEQGFQQGLQTAREMLLEAVATRFGEVPQDITTAVQRLETVEPLRGLLRQALTCTSLEAFREALHTVQR
jgi:hypothetical protein